MRRVALTVAQNMHLESCLVCCVLQFALPLQFDTDGSRRPASLVARGAPGVAAIAYVTAVRLWGCTLRCGDCVFAALVETCLFLNLIDVGQHADDPLAVLFASILAFLGTFSCLAFVCHRNDPAAPTDSTRAHVAQEPSVWPMVVHDAADGAARGPECVICLDEIGEDAEALPCAHVFHARCIGRWKAVSVRCPLCCHDANGPRAA